MERKSSVRLVLAATSGRIGLTTMVVCQTALRRITPTGPRVAPARSAPIRPTNYELALRSDREAESIRPDHLEHVFLLDLEIIAFPPRAHDRAGQSGLVDAVPDHGLVDVNGDDFAERQPGLCLFAIGAL